MHRAEDAVFNPKSPRGTLESSLNQKSSYVAGCSTTIIVCCVALFNVQFITEQ
jgi:hypothetical protein